MKLARVHGVALGAQRKQRHYGPTALEHDREEAQQRGRTLSPERSHLLSGVHLIFDSGKIGMVGKLKARIKLCHL